jgi:hypothetical protein
VAEKLTDMLAEYRARQNYVPPPEKPDRTDEILAALESVSSHLSEVISAVKGIHIPEAQDRTDEVLERLNALPEPDMQPVLDAVKNIHIPEQKDVDLSSVNRAIQSIPEQKDVDLSPVIDAVNELKQEDQPRQWRIVHERDKRGNITGTRVVAD